MARLVSRAESAIRSLARLTNSLTGAAVDLGLNVVTSWAAGTGLNQFNTQVTKTGIAIASGNALAIDLYDLGSLDVGAGAGDDGLGLALVNAEIVELTIHNRESSEGTLVVGGGTDDDEWDDLLGTDGSMNLIPNTTVQVRCPAATAYAVTDSTKHILNFAASGGDVTFDLDFKGRDS